MFHHFFSSLFIVICWLSPKNTRNWPISLFLVQQIVLLEFLVVAVLAFASQVSSSHRINNTQSLADTDDKL